MRAAPIASDQVLAALKKITPLPVRYIINTGADADHVGGNGKLSKAGLTIFTNALGNANFGNAMTNGGAASILAHDSILRRDERPYRQDFGLCCRYLAYRSVLHGRKENKNE